MCERIMFTYRRHRGVFTTDRRAPMKEDEGAETGGRADDQVALEAFPDVLRPVSPKPSRRYCSSSNLTEIQLVDPHYSQGVRTDDADDRESERDPTGAGYRSDDERVRAMALLLSRFRALRLTEPVLRQMQIRGKRKKAGKQAVAAMDDDDGDAIDVGAVDTSMSKVIESLQKSLSRLRSSGANPELLDGTSNADFAYFSNPVGLLTCAMTVRSYLQTCASRRTAQRPR